MSGTNPQIDQFNAALSSRTYAELDLGPEPTVQVVSWTPPFPAPIDQMWGIPTLDNAPSASKTATVQYLWEIFFTEAIKLSPDAWAGRAEFTATLNLTNAQYYTQIFKQYLQEWFSTLSTGTNAHPYLSTNAPAPPIPGQAAPGTPPGETPVIFNLPAGLTTATFTFQDWLTMDADVSWYALQPQYLHIVWSTYLTSVNATARTQSAFLWVYTQLISLIRNVEIAAINQGQRVSALITAQRTSVHAIQGIIFKTPSRSSDSKDLTDNQQYQMWIQVYQGKASVNNSYVSQQNGRVQQTTQAIQDLDSLMTNLIQQMQTILSNLFRT